MNPYVKLAISMAVALFSGCATKLFLSKYSKTSATRFLYQAVSAGVAVIILAVWNGSFHASLFTVLLGVLFGALTAAQTIFSMKAIQTGPWSYTSVITSLSTIIPTLSGAIIWKETIAPVQIVGICLMAVCICLSSNLKKDGEKANLRWMLYCGGAFLMTGFIGVLQKWHQSTAYKGELNEFLVIALSLSCLFSIVMTVVETLKANKKVAAYERALIENPEQAAAQNPAPTGSMLKSVLTFVPIAAMLVSGAGVAVNNNFNLDLSGKLDSSVFYPVVNGGGLMLTTLAATLIFKEKLTWKQWLGLAIGAVAVILLCNPF